MKREWFEPGPDGKSQFERLSATVGFGAAGTAAAFRMLLSEEASNDVTSLRTEIYQLRESLERSRQAVNTTREQRDRFWSQRDAARAEVERLTAQSEGLVHDRQMAEDQYERLTDERDAARAEVERLTARIAEMDPHGDRWVLLGEWNKAAAERDALQARIDAILTPPYSSTPSPLDHIADAGKMADERTGKADRREINCDDSFEARLVIGRDHTREYSDNIDCSGTVKCARSNCRRVTPGTRADRRAS